MATYTSNLKDWGASGQAYPNGYSFAADEPPVDVYDNFFNHNVIEDIQHLINLTNDRIEADKGATGGEPTSPETSHLYHDQGNYRLRVWDSSVSSWRDLMFRDGDTMTGALNMGGNGISGSGSITDNSGNTIFDSANNHVPVSILQQGSGSGLDADTVDGFDATDLGSDVSNNGTLIASKATDINFAQNLSVTDDGDGTVTIDSADQPDSHTAVSEDGTQTIGSVDDINFQGHLNVIDDGDGTVSLDPTHNHDSRYYTESEMDTKLGNKLNSSNRYSDSEARTAVDGSSVSLNHDNLSGVSSGDHHSRYSDSEARSAVEGTSSITDLNGASAPLQLEVYATEADLPNASEGEIAYVQATGQIYVEDGS